MYKLLALDIDGTMLNDRHELTDEVRGQSLQPGGRGSKSFFAAGGP